MDRTGRALGRTARKKRPPSGAVRPNRGGRRPPVRRSDRLPRAKGRNAEPVSGPPRSDPGSATHSGRTAPSAAQRTEAPWGARRVGRPSQRGGAPSVFGHSQRKIVSRDRRCPFIDRQSDRCNGGPSPTVRRGMTPFIAGVACPSMSILTLRGRGQSGIAARGDRATGIARS